jgi:putative transposase
VKAGIIEKAKDYKWSSYQQYINLRNDVEELVDRDQLLSLISDREERAIEIFKKYSNETGEEHFIEADWEAVANREEIEGEDLKKEINTIFE